ncbi:SF3a splicing factor complex subunit [Taxawa tesnikishii (nom. ined.)]|nr:SF3a splicing factor complex subunit [Dothideales sp. JES 119]
MAPAPVADQNGIDPADVIGKAPLALSFLQRKSAMSLRKPTIKDNPKLSFLSDNDPYNAYYLWRLEEYKEGRGTSIATGQEGAIPAPAKQEKKGPEAPKEFQFSARMPTINAVDLEIVKLTALFVAKNGRGWMTQLAQRENRNYQFDFCARSTVSTSSSPASLQKERIKELEHNVENKYHILDRARQRAEWVKYQEAQKVKKEEDEKVEQLAYAQIDWHDFSVVETIVFNEADDQIDLPLQRH